MSLIVSIFALIISYNTMNINRKKFKQEEIAIREEALRKTDVQLWANESIEVLQTIWLLTGPHGARLEGEQRTADIQTAGRKASIQLEKGRILFQNKPCGDFGAAKEPAYRGVRPTILDELFVGYELSLDWSELSSAERQIAHDIISSSERRFVSLVQLEIGRQRTASEYTGLGGTGFGFRELLEEYRTTGRLDREPIDGAA